MSRLLTAFFLAFGLCAGIIADDMAFDFSEGKWNPSEWKYLRVWPYKKQAPDFKPEPGSFKQEKDCVSADFEKEQVKSGDDNTALIIDGVKPSGEIVVEFEMDEWRGTAPGICLFPTCDEDMVLQRGVAIFTASYTTAVWQAEFDGAEKITRYKLMGMTVKWFDPEKRHIMRCRFGGNNLVVSVDGSDPAYYWLQPWFPPFKDAAKSPDVIKPNGKIGIWGCHGKCKFYSLKILEKPTLPLMGEKPKPAEDQSVR